MTREEAIHVLSCLREVMQIYKAQIQAQAIDMAIEALQEPKWNCTASFVAEQLERLTELTSEERVDFLYKFLGITDKENKSADSLLTDSSEADKERDCKLDLISRQAAIRWVKTECNPYGKPTLDFESGKKVIEHLKQMPSADAEPKWGCTANFVAEQLDKLEDMTVKEKVKLIQDLLGVELKEESLNYKHATLVDIKEPLKVAVVRCKDCKHWHSNTEFCGIWSFQNIAQRTLSDDYCSRGERREP